MGTRSTTEVIGQRILDLEDRHFDVILKCSPKGEWTYTHTFPWPRPGAEPDFSADVCATREEAIKRCVRTATEQMLIFHQKVVWSDPLAKDEAVGTVKRCIEEYEVMLAKFRTILADMQKDEG